MQGNIDSTEVTRDPINWMDGTDPLYRTLPAESTLGSSGARSSRKNRPEHRGRSFGVNCRAI